MKEILFLAHRIPYPPNKGDKIRAFHMLKWLAARYRVHVGAFVDEPEDWSHAPKLKEFCQQICLRPLNPRLARLRSLKGFASREALTLPYYRDQVMRRWVGRLLQERPVHAVVAFSSCMAQYADNRTVRRIMDFVDLDSDKWRQFSATQVWPWSWVYRREACKLQESEAYIAADFDASVFVSRNEAKLFSQVNPGVSARVAVIRNGVDTTFFSPDQRGVNPYPRDINALVFTGAMDYWPNVHAVVWFAREIFPRIRSRVTNATFYIVGAHPARAVLLLSKEPGIKVVGKVSDVRPYIAHAKVAVAPLRLARGVQNKVLEAMAMAKPVLMTKAARNGLEVDPLCDSLIADDPQAFADKAIMFLGSEAPFEIGEQCRRYVQRHYNWNRNLEALAALLETNTAPRLLAEAV